MAKQPVIDPKRIVILGATSAIAQATARRLLEKGGAGEVSFFLVARDPYKLDAVANDLRTRGARAVTSYAMDLDNTEAHAEMLSSAAFALGMIDMALVAYGVLGNQRAAEMDPRLAEAVYRTNFLSPASLITWLANYFEGHSRGCLAVISSVAGDRGRQSNYVYGASKAALNVLVDGLRNRIDRTGVQVLLIKPGFVATPMTAHLPRGPLFAEPRAIGAGIVRAVENRRDTVYLPGFWRVVMFMVKSVPGFLFKNLNM
ncbi:SDR family oxidoreductase [Acidipila sp. EB88]|uniref:SDR family oxidoreductase n=1 Tax=Acidipila sp. EB88 TaxID=2305226 RepID=UPI000F5DF3DC|nr:SDR family oxidoreductase [Acidipila sp. EB88]RRA48449.1 SDR family oxidoreductase [Acidipila sp. EB88]